ncbi:DUF1284 domain-containing protein [Neobacillus soli]|uniref:DUF1284 domain-containing protein n=1 Tax=Neobacillus soli TaxID=220688 RepID=UPI002287665E|nr:DUF1284 domain-containing protein [Neobacillus soli]
MEIGFNRLVRGKYHCLDENIYERNADILEKMGLKIGRILSWKDIESCIRKFVVPTDIQIVCETCSWRSYAFVPEKVNLFFFINVNLFC